MEGKIKDPRYPENLFKKMESTKHPGAEVHFWENIPTGVRSGFKFK